MRGVEHGPGTLILLGLFAFVSTWSALSGLRTLLRLNPERHWVPVPGVISQSHVTGKRQKTPMIRYTYEYQGRRYVGEAVSPTKVLYSSSEAALEAASRYPYGAHVTVFVNPQNPLLAVLEPIQDSRESLIETLGGVAGLLVVAVLYLTP